MTSHDLNATDVSQYEKQVTCLHYK